VEKLADDDLRLQQIAEGESRVWAQAKSSSSKQGMRSGSAVKFARESVGSFNAHASGDPFC
jgi:hypothetical protein